MFHYHRPRAILDIIKSGEDFRIATSTKMPEQGTCERCGYISSQVGSMDTFTRDRLDVAHFLLSYLMWNSLISPSYLVHNSSIHLCMMWNIFSSFPSHCFMMETFLTIFIYWNMNICCEVMVFLKKSFSSKFPVSSSASSSPYHQNYTSLLAIF